MANYNVDIELAVKGNQRVEQQLKKLEELVVKIGSKAKNIDLGGQIRLKGEQKLLKEKIKDQVAWNKEQKKSIEIAKELNQRIQGLSQFGKPIGPNASGSQEFRKEKRILELSRRLNAVEASRTKRLQQQNSLTSGLLKLNKASLQAARAEAQARGENLDNQRQLNRELAKSQQYNKPIGPKPARAGGGAAKGGNRGLSNLALGVGFPLLFGGGLGSVAGGALGSVGGMGGQVLGSAIGGIVDQAVGSIAELGKALNPFTADVEAVTAAAGESGTAFERLVSQLEEAAGKEKALEVATAQLATIIGSEGVDALKEFGDASSDLSNELSKALTALGAALAPVLADITRATANAVERSRLVNKGTNDLRDDPRIQQIRSDLSERKIGELEAEDKIAELVRQLELEEQIKIAKQAQADLQAKIDEKTSSLIALTEQKLVIEQNGGDILNEQVQTALQNIDAEKIRLKILEAQGDQLKLNLAFKEGQLLAAIRTAKIEAATGAKEAKEQREREAAARKAEREQEARDRKEKLLQRSIFNENLKQLQIQSKINQLDKSNIEVIELQREEVKAVFASKVNQVKIVVEDLSLRKEIIETLNMQASLELDGLDRAEQRLALAKDLAELSAGAGFDVSAPFERNMKFVGGKSVLDTGPASFEEGIDLAPLIEYEVQLDRILEKYPMIGEAATAAAGLVTFGVQEMIDGTKSAEEVFADFLNNIADMLLKTAQQMIAQYIAIGIAKMFAGFNPSSFSSFSGSMSGGSPFSPGTTFNVPSPAFDTFADGGRPPVGRPSIVGERGPELFVPGASGTIIPNEAMGGTNVVVNVDASGSEAEGDAPKAKQLGSLIGAAVQAELVKQKRPGGILAS